MDSCVIGKNIVLASQTGARLDSCVINGGGTDDTAILQAVLDRATEPGGLHLIMDGAALISGLQLHSNTTIECLNSSCGFFLAPQSNQALLRNIHMNLQGERQDCNIQLIGGTYNHNCRNQVHHLQREKIAANGDVLNDEKWIIGFEFYGVENLTVRDLTLRNQRTFGMLIANWRHVVMENIIIDLPDLMDCQNQDGIHFWGPGQFLSMRNIKGRSGDDFIALAPDEYDMVSDITDVVIDGVFLDDADQGIRLLSRDKGRLDRVTIRNVTGTYKSFGFYINPWFPGTGGNFGNIVFENIDLRQTTHKYNYTNAFLFRIGGNVESIICRNILHINPSDTRVLFDLGKPFYTSETAESYQSRIDFLQIDGLYVRETASSDPIPSYISAEDCKVGTIRVRNVQIDRPSSKKSGCLLKVAADAEVGNVSLRDIKADNVETLVDAAGKIANKDCDPI